MKNPGVTNNPRLADFSYYGAARVFLERSGEAVLITDAPADGSDHRIVFANQAFQKICGYDLDELIGRSPKMFQGPETDQSVLADVRTAIEEGKEFAGKATNYRKSGDPYVIDWRISPIHDADANICCWLSWQRDITHEIQQEQSVRDLNERLALTVEASGDGVWDWDLQTDELYWSQRFKDIVGVKDEDFQPIVATFFDRLVENDRARVRQAVEAHIYEKVPYDIEYEMVREDGSVVLIHARGQAVWGEDDKPTRMVGTVRDVSDFKRLQRNLLRAEQIANFGSWEFDVGSQQLYWSPQVFRIHGLEPAEVAPDLEPAIAYYHADDQDMVRTRVGSAIDQGTGFTFEARIEQESGAQRSVFSEGGVETAQDGRVVKLFGIFQDQTELKEKEIQLARSQRTEAIGQLVGGVAHDFNNLLAAILGNLELLQDYDDPDEAQECLTASIGAVQRGADLTQSLLSFARVAPLQPSIFAPLETLKKVLTLLNRTLPATIHIELRDSETVWPVRCDESMLEACILNLAFNARDAMPNGGHLTLTVSHSDVDETVTSALDVSVPPGRFVVLSVTDSGTGMEPEQLKKAVEPFFTTKPVGQGTGLGLSRVKGFAEQSGGFFTLYSELRRGTSASIYLPADVSSADTEKTPTHAVDKVKTKLRVLLVEDDDLVRSAMSRSLRSIGVDVSTAASGDEAFETIEQRPDFDVLVTDVVMPGALQGPDLVRQLRRSGKAEHVIYISGYPREALGDDLKLGGTDVCLVKPVSRKALIEALDRLHSGVS